MRNFVTMAAFRLVQSALLPAAAVGYVLFVITVVRFSRRNSTSATALASLYTRYMQHCLGTRADEPAYRLMHVLPNVHPLGLQLVTLPTRVAHRLTGYVPGIYRYPFQGVPSLKDQAAARTTFYDLALKQHIEHVDQLVILGAGFDTRGYRVPAGARLRVFEIDTARTQAFKREMLRKAAVVEGHITYVAADFMSDDWLEKLVEAGFDPTRPTFFTWESVSMYLDRHAVTNTLRTIAGTGGVVAFDYFSTEIIESPSLYMRYARAMIRATGEPWRFGIDNTPPVRERVAAFLESCGLELQSQRNFGAESGGRRAPAGFAVAASGPDANV